MRNEQDEVVSRVVTKVMEEKELAKQNASEMKMKLEKAKDKVNELSVS